MLSIVGRNVAGPILAMSVLALFVVVLVLLEPSPARSQDEYSDQYQQYQPSSSSTVPDYTPAPPVGCYSHNIDPQAGQICVNGSEPERNGEWAPWLTSTGEPIYVVQIYSLGLSNVPNEANQYLWQPWAYTSSMGWFLTQ